MSPPYLPASPLHLACISRAPPQVRIEVYKPDEISDDELARSNTIQKSVSSFTRSFTLTGRKKEKEEEDLTLTLTLTLTQPYP